MVKLSDILTIKSKLSDILTIKSILWERFNIDIIFNFSHALYIYSSHRVPKISRVAPIIDLY
jgi:hypothetical protein